jgi:Uma2 family endonuclease
MTETITHPDSADIPEPDIDHLITEDDEPVDNLFSEKQQRLLTESVNASWRPGRPFLAAANVGVFNTIHDQAVVPDVFLSLDARVHENIWEKRNRSNMIWEFGKPPDVVIEVVSNQKGKELGEKLKRYERMRALYYAVFDPQRLIQKEALRIFELAVGEYIPKLDRNLSRVGLGLTLWEGVFEGHRAQWLRWCDDGGNLLATGAESARMERQRADRLAEKLRSLGIDPDEIPG